MRKNVIVVGAGLAGLAAAQVLHRRGLDVTVMEREPRVGGRVHSQAFHGRTIECGAQFPSTGYTHIPAMLAEAGLSTVPCSPWAAFEREGRWHRVHQNRPLSLWSGGLLRAGQFAKMGYGVGKALRMARQFQPANYGSYAAVDDEDAWDWCARLLGPAAAQLVFEPTVHGFYFHPLRGTSRALLHALLAFGKAQAMAIPLGWEALPRWMAQPLHVCTGTQVTEVKSVSAGVQVSVNGESLNADAAVIATPAPVALGLLDSPTPQEHVLMRTPYAGAVHVALGFAAGWHLPEDLRRVHGVLLASHNIVAAMVVEQSRLPSEAPEVLTLMLGSAAAQRLEARSNAEVLEEVMAWLRARWPALPTGVVAHRVHRWRLAEPLSPPGRARAVQHYRASLTPGRRVFLCGDSTGMPWSDGAVETGLWAAARVLDELS